jgi:hypothetical protein
VCLCTLGCHNMKLRFRRMILMLQHSGGHVEVVPKSHIQAHNHLSPTTRQSIAMHHLESALVHTMVQINLTIGVFNPIMLPLHRRVPSRLKLAGRMHTCRMQAPALQRLHSILRPVRHHHLNRLSQWRLGHVL